MTFVVRPFTFTDIIDAEVPGLGVYSDPVALEVIGSVGPDGNRYALRTQGVVSGISIGQIQISKDLGETWGVNSSGVEEAEIEDGDYLRIAVSPSALVNYREVLEVRLIDGNENLVATLTITTKAPTYEVTPFELGSMTVPPGGGAPIRSGHVAVSGPPRDYAIPVTTHFANTSGAVFKSSNGGDTWLPVSVLNPAVGAGDWVLVQLARAPEPGGVSTALLNIGGTKSSFTLLTEAPDEVPTPFEFAPVVDAERDAPYVSNAITVEGIPAGVNVPAAVDGGQYSISTDGGVTWTEWSSGVAVVQLGTQIRVRTISAVQYGGEVVATLDINGQVGAFSVTTKADSPAAPDPDPDPDPVPQPEVPTAVRLPLVARDGTPVQPRSGLIVVVRPHQASEGVLLADFNASVGVGGVLQMVGDLGSPGSTVAVTVSTPGGDLVAFDPMRPVEML